MIFFLSFATAIEPMKLRTIKEIKSVEPYNVSNLGFGVFEVSATYNLGSYHGGKWIPFDNKNKNDLKYGPVWVEFGWERPYTDIILIDGLGIERKIYLPSNSVGGNSLYSEYFWIAEDGSSYYAHSSHKNSWPDLTYEEALKPEHLARKSLSPNQKNPDIVEPQVQEPSLDKMTKIKGKLVDKETNMPINGARLSSAYAFKPEEVMTGENGEFEFYVNKDLTGSWSFYDDCHGSSENIGLQKDFEVWIDGKLNNTIGLALRIDGFDMYEKVSDQTNKGEIIIGNLYAHSKSDISIETDIPTSFNVMIKNKNMGGFNGPGQYGFTNDHYLSDALPIGYEVYIEFSDSGNNKFNSSSFYVPNEASCGLINLKYKDGKSEWSVIKKAVPKIEEGPIVVQIPEAAKKEKPKIIEDLCMGCYKDSKCYPFGYRKSTDFCKDTGNFVNQLGAESDCENNFECISNVCISGKCVNESLMKKIIYWFKNFF